MCSWLQPTRARAASPASASRCPRFWETAASRLGTAAWLVSSRCSRPVRTPLFFEDLVAARDQGRQGFAPDAFGVGDQLAELFGAAGEAPGLAG